MPDKKTLCLAVDDEPPALEVLKKYISSMQSLELAGTCCDAIEAINFLQTRQVDLIFLDIKMPELLGTDFIRTLKTPPKVIFTTAYRKYALEGFELEAADYLLKPISFERFLKAVNKVIKKDTGVEKEFAHNNHDPEFICVRADRKMVKIFLDDILYIESLKDYIKIVTTAKALLTKQSISAVEEMLPKNVFIRIHRSYIISLKKVQSYTSELIEIDKHELPVSRMYRREVEQALHAPTQL
ncbi:DNA-binding response regulator [Niastella yeongjuensis]|uniref:DNA-binding response regulator n=1 Tax=Niastella yeongjuensis TaxID=354355 RepID=A0A1V9E4G6_9BACT|nr:LytTR family DNA-binding domain-containing protein [Niastella yeongjuensis]OQP40914.1 DNA-binding response regulator [Niastella yeongjuensis]SEO98021.1 two component transcriptional regulator, LytTR family [Niastella yeongjuensis]